MAYLNAEGLTEVWAKCKQWFARRITANASAETVTVTLLNNSGDTPSSTTGSQNVATIPAATTSLAGVMTATDKSKLNGITAGAEPNVQSDWNAASTSDAYIKNKPSLAAVATSGNYSDLSGAPSIPDATSDLTNDSGFITSADVPSAATAAPKMDGTAAAGTGTTWARADHVHPKDTSKANLASPTFTGTPKAPTADAGTNSTQIATTAFVATAIGNAISGIQGISYQVVASLPATGAAGVIYLVSNGGTGQNSYDEYIWLGSAYEKIGTTAVDLSGYWSKTELEAMSTADVDAICV